MVLLLTALALGAPDAFDEESAAPETEISDPGIGVMPQSVLQAANEVADRPLVERMDAISASLLGRPYLADPLGEGRGPDPDPFARYDTFDCLTYVEEVLALSIAGDPAHAAPVRNALRYGDAEPTYDNRRHFMELQWIPGAVEDGWLRDTTAEYGDTVTLEREWTMDGWANWAGRAKFHHSDETLPVGTMKLEVLPLEAAHEAIDKIRPGSILLTVREDRPYKPVWVTHVGFVFHEDGKPVLRHATKMGSGGTRNHSLEWYLDHIEIYKWKALGVTILEPIEAGPRMARLPH